MKKELTCCFIGHRRIIIKEELKNKLKNLIEDLIISYNVTTFLFGSKSEFNDLCHSIVTELKLKYSFVKRINYTCRSEVCILESEKDKWEKIYSNFFKEEVTVIAFEKELEHRTKYKSGKASYIERNCAMIDNSDYCIFYYDNNYQPLIRKHAVTKVIYQPKSGTKIAYNYAKQKNKNLINVKE